MRVAGRSKVSKNAMFYMLLGSWAVSGQGPQMRRPGGARPKHLVCISIQKIAQESSGLRGLASALGAQNCSKSPRARPELLRAAQNRLKRAALSSRSELLEKPIGELGVTCTLHIRCSVLLHLVPSSSCMHMHGFALV